MRSRKALGIALILLGGACGSKDSISLSASVSNVELTLAEKTLGTYLSGSFDLYLEVGPEADSGATVQLDIFSLVRAGDHSTLIPSLDAAPQGVSIPVKVGKGEHKTITFQLDATNPVSAAKADLCSGQVQVKGTVKHDLNGGETQPTESQPVTINGC
jgi:hypothetical protein